ncbi:class II D-tagatose-bisphosphate aldolase non-catalytic subunit [Pseudomonadota bacterium]
MIHQRLSSFLKKRRCTLIGVGPMSQNCVDASIELANDYKVPIMLIASRRQIDAADLGGGYVNGWATEQFAEYVIDRDKQGKIFLARDHGGPWQNDREKGARLSFRRAMESAKHSYRVDIESGFQILHIDTSVDIFSDPNVDEALDRLFELYEFCWSTAQKLGTDVAFEIGTEEQSGSTNTQEELDYTLNQVFSFCRQYNLPQPTFVVIQSGTRVMETRNVGSFDSPIRVADELPAEIQLPKMIEICERYGIFMKEHNTDYLSDESLQWHPRFGIHAANVAPEFGVTESRTLINLLEQYALSHLSNRFLEIAYDSRKWEKWLLPDSSADERERAIIAGHYVFADPKVLELKREAQSSLASKKVDLDALLKEAVKSSILRYLKNFRLVS